MHHVFNVINEKSNMLCTTIFKIHFLDFSRKIVYHFFHKILAYLKKGTYLFHLSNLGNNIIFWEAFVSIYIQIQL